MSTHSLLKNTEEFKQAKVRLLPFSAYGVQNLTDEEWLRTEVNNRCIQMPDYSFERVQVILSMFIPAFSHYKTKERLLSAIQVGMIPFYIDVHLAPIRKERSALKAHQLMNVAIEALSTGECDQQSIFGKSLLAHLQMTKFKLKNYSRQVYS